MKARLYVVSLVLAVACFLVFGGALRHEFVHFDDDDYITKNAQIHTGLNGDNVRWAFTATHVSNWHPVTWLSHLLDIQLFGLEPAGHHFSSLLLHALNSVLLMWVLFRLTGQWWLSVVVAFLFALHPLRVESVAWVSERKDLLCAFFGLLTLWAYERFVRVRTAGRYLLMCLFFALGLMSKPMIVTWPFVLLLLDIWPLQRIAPANWSRLLIEKIPLFLLVAASSIITFHVQQAGGAVQALELYSLPVRLANAFVSYVEYVRLLFWPAHLAFYYPHPGNDLSWTYAGVAAVLLMTVTAGAFVTLRSRPWFFVGWCWYIGTLVPVIGLVQVGDQAMADRYTYLPHIGLLILLVWSGHELYSAFGNRHSAWVTTLRRAALCLLALTILSLSLLAYRQTATWRDSETLFLHAITVTDRNSLAHNNLGAWYATHERPDEALEHLLRSLEIRPGYIDAHHNIANVYLMTGRSPDAARHYREVLRARPNHAAALNNLAWITGNNPNASVAEREEALRHAQHLAYTVGFRTATTLNTLAGAYAALGHYDSAVRILREALVRARQEGNEPLAQRLERRMKDYETQRSNPGMH